MTGARPYGVRYSRTRDGEPLSNRLARYGSAEAADREVARVNAAPPVTEDGYTYDNTAVREDRA